MAILQVRNISLSFGDRNLLNNVSFTLGEHARAALAGGNGEGKTTLMKIIAGLMQKDGGSVVGTKGMSITYLPQSDIVLRDNTVYEEIEKAFDVWKQNLERQREIESIIVHDHTPALLEELNSLQEKLLDGPYYRREAVIYSIASGLGLSSADMNRRCNEFSGGFQMRIALAKVLAQSPDVMMLDEPTNYLDLEARIWLRGFLKSYSGSLLIVCHDRAFLDDTVNEVYELFNGNLTRYSGNYSSYEKQRRLEIEQLQAAWERQQAEIDRTEQFIERFRYKATKARQVQSRIKALEKIEPVVVPSHLKTVSFRFPEPGHSPNDMVVIDNMTKCYGDNVVYRNFSLHVGKGQRLAVTGHNGAGKSTLLRIIAGQDSNYSGTVKLGPGIHIGYYSQDTADSLDMDGTVFSQVSAYGNEGQIRNALGAFLFHGDDIEKRASVLSGGERSRLALLKILLQPANLLILDEPTNHLDISAKTMLLNALKLYTGTIIFVSHDAQFIKELADSILYLSEDEPQLFRGDYDYFEYRLSLKNSDSGNQTKTQSPEPEPAKEAKTDWAEANRRKNRLRKLERETEALLEQIGELDKRLAETDALINLPENYSDPVKINALLSEKKTLESEKAELEGKWLENTALLEESES